MNTFNGILRPVFVSEFCFCLLPHYNMAATKKNQVLLASNTSQPNLLCFGFDLTQSQSSKPISRNGYGPNCSPLLSLRTSLRCIEGVFEAPSTKFMCIIYVYYLCVNFCLLGIYWFIPERALLFSRNLK